VGVGDPVRRDQGKPPLRDLHAGALPASQR
jgi:hypothetical protein